ncbi:glycoside hydrolase family 73 protein [Lactobacillus psittaci]|uniref:Mannosyl-glycoprotein endo-beta-N-acetylglucosaminidase n=1 Tax=Lactobacillus psittaci DSM 15354 TaxID=1122152 RepID=A0A0R1S8B6_9LACO|nr:glycoside hydrolase family 73 protein [Lactobacillus psittaci]KRL61755.1 mannosyl-glycoprotein endo-beta-N-acetylglucosaminidase [Lactobacillus psittaci DSM 15354]
MNMKFLRRGITAATLAAILLSNSNSLVLAVEQSKANSAKTEQATDRQPSQDYLAKDPSIGPGYYEFSNGKPKYDLNSILYANVDATTFFNSIKAGAMAGWKKGILPSITAAQAAIESGWGATGGARIANNLFGIKGTYNGQGTYLRTTEYRGGRYVSIVAQFRKYPNWATSIEDHANFLVNNSRYHNLLFQKDYRTFARLLLQDGYATDPNYASKIINFIQIYGLQSWDQEAFNGNTGSGITQESEDIAQIKYVPGYGVLGFTIDGKYIPGSNYKFKDGTRWKVLRSVVINGQEMYDLGAGQYVPKAYTDHYDNGVVTIHYVPNYGVNAWRSDGTQIAGSNLKFKTGSRWKICGVKMINGEICYLVGIDTYIPKKYTQWGAGK